MKLSKKDLPLAGSWKTASDVDLELAKRMTHRQKCVAMGLPTLNSYTVWSGTSQLDESSPVYLRLTGFKRRTDNSKTGWMVQSFIMRSDMDPHEATKTGKDSAVCGDCKHSWSKGGKCYVLVFQAPKAAHKGMTNNPFASFIAPWQASILLIARALRCGSYGDPSAVPLPIWHTLLAHTKTHTGYTHQWRQPKFEGYLSFLMASVDSLDEARLALSRGYRYFRVKSRGETEKLEGEIECLSDSKNISCDKCGLCDGDRASMSNANARKSVWIEEHGNRI